MLSNPKWKEQDARARAFKLETLIEWLEKQPARAGYYYHCNGECLLASYFSAMGFEDVYMYTSGFTHGEGKRGERNLWEAKGLPNFVPLPNGFNRIAQGSRSDTSWDSYKDWTFGEALQRARALLQERARAA